MRTFLRNFRSSFP